MKIWFGLFEPFKSYRGNRQKKKITDATVIITTTVLGVVTWIFQWDLLSLLILVVTMIPKSRVVQKMEIVDQLK